MIPSSRNCPGPYDGAEMLKQRLFAAGTALMGYLPAELTEAEISAFMGFQPIITDDGKTTREWIGETPAGAVVTVYDYKGDRWHVGGSGRVAAEQVFAALGFRRA